MKTRRFLVVAMSLAALLLTSCGVSQDVYDDILAERNAKQAQVTSLQGDLTKANSELTAAKEKIKTLQSDYDTASKELAELKKVYPPREFSSKKELQDWLFSNDVSDRPITEWWENWYGYALDIQEDATKDGYIVSAWIDWDPDDNTFQVLCSTVINGEIYMWDPETDELFSFSDASGLPPVR